MRHTFDENAFDSNAFDCAVEVPAVVPPSVVSGLNESSPSEGGFLVQKDVVEVRGKFIFRNAPPDQSAFVKVRGQALRDELGDVKAVGVVDMTDEELVAFLLLADEEAEAEEVAEAAKLAAESAVRTYLEEHREQIAAVLTEQVRRAADIGMGVSMAELQRVLKEMGIDCKVEFDSQVEI